MRSCSLPRRSCEEKLDAARGVLGKMTPAGVMIDSDQTFVMHLLDAAGVATIHGSAYGLPCYVRMSIATSDQTLEAACHRIGEMCASLK